MHTTVQLSPFYIAYYFLHRELSSQQSRWTTKNQPKESRQVTMPMFHHPPNSSGFCQVKS